MGAVAAAILDRPEHVRGQHPLCSFSAVGPQARRLIAPQSVVKVYAPLDRLGQAGGSIVLMGVGLEALTLLHLAEQRAGRQLFWRWANDAAGRSRSVAVPTALGAWPPSWTRSPARGGWGGAAGGSCPPAPRSR
jgi:aminoglycoside 3-N-acetyltransferase